MSKDDIRQKKRVLKILGSCNCLVIVPDGFSYKGKENLLTHFAISFIAGIEAYGVINCKYKNTIIDLNNTQEIRRNRRISNEFLTPLYNFDEEIRGNTQSPLALVFTMPDQLPSPMQGADIIIGTGQGERGNSGRPHRSTFPPSLLTRLMVSLSDSGFTAELAAIDSQLCGREENCLNQLFFQKNLIKNKPAHNSQSLLFTLGTQAVGENIAEAFAQGKEMAKALSHFFKKMPLVRQVPIRRIKAASYDDQKYIFRVNNDGDATQSLIREGYIEELADSIKQSGLLHPLVLLQKQDGNYKILCGFRRYQAVTRLGEEWIEAKIYKEDNFSKEEFFNISLAENTRRRNLNPVEIGNFLESAAQELGLNNAQLAEKFGKILGIGHPKTKVSQATIHKYRKVNAIRTRKESPEIISAIINERLQFTIAAEILAPIKDPKSRNRFHIDIIKALEPTRPQIIQIKKLLEKFGTPLAETLTRVEIIQGIQKALISKHSAAHFIKTLQKIKMAVGKKSKKNPLQQKTLELQSILVGENLKKSDLKLTPSKVKNKSELTLQIKIRPDNLQEAIQTLTHIEAHQQQLSEIFNNN